MEPLRVKLEASCQVPDKEFKINRRRSGKYQKVTWGVLRYPPCAVVGGGHSVKNSLDILKAWKGDIFAINDTAKYLSDNGIPHYLYAIDATKTPFLIGEHTKGAMFATRVHRCQFKQFKENQVRTFDMAEEDRYKGIEGGPTAVCRTPHLFLRMGYMQVHYFGIDGSFVGQSHINADQKYAYEAMIVVRVGNEEYLTNGAMMLQHEYMVDVFKKYGKFLINRSGGLIDAMLKNQDTWEVVAVSSDLKAQFEKGGDTRWSKEYTFSAEVRQPLVAAIA